METIQTSQVKQRVDREVVKSRGIQWGELKFPPINLWNIYPTEAMCKLHAEEQDPTLWLEY